MTTNDTPLPSPPEEAGIPACPQKPWMTDEELECFRKWIPKGGAALEFGMGGSTRFFFENGIDRLNSVESDPAWVKTMAHDPFLAFFIRKKRLILHCADIGPVRELGLPLTGPNLSWLTYHQNIWRFIDTKPLKLILIDGRFRLACACQALLRCSHQTPLLIHDFSTRPEYHAILEFTDVLDSAGTSVVLRQKQDVDFRALALVLQDAQFEPL